MIRLKPWYAFMERCTDGITAKSIVTQITGVCWSRGKGPSKASRTQGRERSVLLIMWPKRQRGLLLKPTSLPDRPRL